VVDPAETVNQCFPFISKQSCVLYVWPNFFTVLKDNNEYNNLYKVACCCSLSEMSENFANYST